LFKLKHAFVVSVLVGLSLCSLGCQAIATGYQYKGTVTTPPRPVPDFELMAVNGQPFRLSQVEGDIVLLYFGYTSCPDVCPLTMFEVKQALAGLEAGQDRVHVIFISVDPDRDTPQVLSQYMAAFGPQFIGLRDDMEKVAEVMKPYGAVAEKEEVSDSKLGYLVSHTTRLYLVDGQRRLFLQYPFGFAAEDLRGDLAHLLQQEDLVDVKR
jgi:protein SCO1/2